MTAPTSPFRLRRPQWNPLILALPAIAFVGVFGVYPLVSFLWGSLDDGDGLSLDHYGMLLASNYFFGVLARTVGTALIVTAVCLILAFPVAYALLKARGRAKLVIIALVILPYLTSVLVRTYAWSALLSLNGPVNDFLVAIGAFTEPQLIGRSPAGTLIGMSQILTPVAALTLWSRMEKIDPSQSLVAEALGASRVRAFFTVFVPQSLSGLVSAGILVYVLALGAYVIPAELGGTQGFLFAQAIVDQATTLLNWPLSGAMGVAMLVAAALPAVLYAAIRGIAGRVRVQRRAVSVTQNAAARWIYPVLELVGPRGWTWLWRIAAGLVLAFLIVPELVILVFSFGPQTSLGLPPAYVTLDGYHDVLTDPSWLEPLGRSVTYALIDAGIAVVVGGLAAYGFARGAPRWAAVGTVVLIIPIVLPEIVMAISYYIFANDAGLAGTDAGIVLGQAVSAIGVVTLIIVTVAREVDINLEYAAQMSGASRPRVLREIVLPLILPGIVVGFVYGLLNAFDNLVMPLFIAGAKPTVTVRMFNSMQEKLSTSPAVIASILIVALMLAILLALVFQRRTGTAIPLPSVPQTKDPE